MFAISLATRKNLKGPQMSHLKILVLVIIALAFANVSKASLLDSNLVINGDAETGDLTGWATDGAETTTSVVFSGDYSFTGATGSSPETMSQVLDLSTFSSIIDSANANFSFSAQLQNRSFDFVEMELSFFDLSNTLVGPILSINDPTNSPFVWDFLGEINGAVDVGVRSASISFIFTRNSGFSSDAYVDEIDFRISSSAIISASTPNLVLLCLMFFTSILFVRKARKQS